MIDILQKEIKEFSEYSRNGYSGGLEGLRCSICDSKYSGDSKFMQLCPRCKANNFLITLLQAQIDEWKESKDKIECNHSILSTCSECSSSNPSMIKNSLLQDLINKNKEYISQLYKL